MKFGESLWKVLRGISRLFPEEEVKPEKLALLIDGENLWNALVDLGKVGIDMGEFVNRLTNEKELVSCPIYYTSVTTEIPEKALRFFEYLNRQGFKIESKPLFKGEEPKSLIDPWIAVGICRFATKEDVSTIVLVSGDHHFVPAIKFAQEKGKMVKVASVEHLFSKELRETSNEWLNLEEIIKGIPQKSKIEKKREEALETLNRGNRVILSTLEESP